MPRGIDWPVLPSFRRLNHGICYDFWVKNEAFSCIMFGKVFFEFFWLHIWINPYWLNTGCSFTWVRQCAPCWERGGEGGRIKKTSALCSLSRRLQTLRSLFTPTDYGPFKVKVCVYDGLSSQHLCACTCYAIHYTVIDWIRSILSRRVVVVYAKCQERGDSKRWPRRRE